MKRTDIINYLIRKYKYETYLEIGVRTPGDNFDKIDCHVKHGVDPKPRGKCKFVMTSDAFFSKNKQKYQLIFIDGLHLEKQVIKDVDNALKCLADNGTIVMHDCNPPTEWNQREVYDSGQWNGTVWRGYMNYRGWPDLAMCVVDCDWGIGIIRKGRQNALIIENITYQNLEQNRKELLNLMPFKDFKLWIKEN